ncbi:MAG: hypothetical protein GQ574_26245 [Crocinitomix sp.]|nr:hypothetical protein [Crocinitomix sp.]
MNKVINVFSGIVLAIFTIFAMLIVFDLSFSSASLKGMPYTFEICLTFAVIIFLLGFLRIKRKWQGAADMKQFKGFHFVRQVSKPGLNHSLIYAYAESVFIVVAIIIFSIMADLEPKLMLPMLIVLAFLLIEEIIFIARLMRGTRSLAFRLGINPKAVAFFNREMHIFYYTGLRRIELHQDMINFQYKDDLNLMLPLQILNAEDRVAFRDALITTLEEHTANNKGKNIYIDDAFRNLE